MKKLLLLSAVVCLLTRCAGVTYYSGPIPRQNIAMFNTRGETVDPATGCSENEPCAHPTGIEFDIMQGDCEAGYLQNIVDAAGKQENRKVLIFIHGGLNNPTSTIERAVSRAPAIRNAGYYPIFINWQSSLVTSYRDHLFRVHQGRFFDYRERRYWMGVPKFGADLARAAWRSPIAAYFEFVNYGQSTQRSKEMVQWRRQATRGDSGQVKINYHKPKHPGEVRNFFGWSLTLPLRFVAGGIIDAAGTPAWQVMLHRSNSLMHRDPDFDPAGYRKAPANQSLMHPPGGGLYKLLDGLRKQKDLKIVIVAHSMGTIVANQILSEFPDLPVTHIVYMAAACSIADYQTAVFPFLRAHPSTRMHHLTLDMQSEVSERRWYGPSGSLLVWIDDYFGQPETRMHRTAGRFTNLLGALHLTPPEIQPRITVTSFRRLNPNEPQQHGDFGEFRFWEKTFWEGTAGERFVPAKGKNRPAVAKQDAQVLNGPDCNIKTSSRKNTRAGSQ